MGGKMSTRANVTLYIAPSSEASTMEECMEWTKLHGKVYKGSNATTTVWCNSLAVQFTSSSSAFAPITYVGVGSNGTTPTIADTTLNTQIGSKVKVGSYFVTGGNVANVAAFFSGSSNNGTWNECGLFDSKGVLIARLTSAIGAFPFTKSSGYVVTVTWSITFTPST